MITFKLKSSSHSSTIAIDGNVAKCREVRTKIAEKLKTNEFDVALYFAGSTSQIHIEEEIPAFSVIEVVRGSNPDAAKEFAAYQRQKQMDSRRPAPPPAITTEPPSGATSEEQALLRLQAQIDEERGGSVRQFRQQVPDALGFRQPNDRYTCHHCGKKGHNIKDCPEASKTGYSRARVVQEPIGIPESSLEPCSADDPNKFTTRDGHFVRRKIDTAAFQSVASVLGGVAPEPSESVAPSYLTCPICNETMRNAVLSPCCGKSACEACMLKNAEEDCPGCPLPGCGEMLMIDCISANEEARREIAEFRRKRPRE